MYPCNGGISPDDGWKNEVNGDIDRLWHRVTDCAWRTENRYRGLSLALLYAIQKVWKMCSLIAEAPVLKLAKRSKRLPSLV